MARTIPARKRLHDLVDRLPEPDAIRMADLLDSVLSAHNGERLTPEEWQEVRKGLSEIRKGHGVRWEAVRDSFV